MLFLLGGDTTHKGCTIIGRLRVLTAPLARIWRTLQRD